MISESVFLLYDGSRVKRHVSKGGEGPRPQKHDKKGNKELERYLGLGLGLANQEARWAHCDFLFR